MEFKESGAEFLPMAKELFEKHKLNLHLSVEPKEIMFLRSDSKRKAFAYCKRVTDEYVLLTDKKYFIVIVNKYFDILKTEEQKKYVILHEMMHLFLDEDGKYKLLDHNLKEFRELLKDPNWNLMLISGKETTTNTPEGEIKIGLDFDFHNKEAMKKLKEQLKEKDSEEETKEDKTE